MPAQKLLVAFKLSLRDGRTPLAKSQGPDVGGPFDRPMPADELVRILFQQHFQGGGSETPVIARIVVNVKVKGTRYQQSAVGTQDAVNFLKTATEAPHVLESA